MSLVDLFKVGVLPVERQIDNAISLLAVIKGEVGQFSREQLRFMVRYEQLRMRHGALLEV